MHWLIKKRSLILLNFIVVAIQSGLNFMMNLLKKKMNPKVLKLKKLML